MDSLNPPKVLEDLLGSAAFCEKFKHGSHVGVILILSLWNISDADRIPLFQERGSELLVSSSRYRCII